MIDKERLINLFEKIIDRSERWIKDAEDREDYSDSYYYQGQKKVVEEVKNMIENW